MQFTSRTPIAGPSSTALLVEVAFPTAIKRFAKAPRVFFEENLRPGGTNGYTTLWGTNAHGKLAGCPPSRH